MPDPDIATFAVDLTVPEPMPYVLCLYVVGATPSSQRAIANLGRLCEETLPGRYTLDVIDVYQRPELATEDHIVATPTLIRKRPEPVTVLVGDMSDRERVLVGLDLPPAPSPTPDGRGSAGGSGP